MHVFWLVSMVLPQAAAACRLDAASDVSGGWLTGQLTRPANPGGPAPDRGVRGPAPQNAAVRRA